jgi:hypothetical protein
MLDSNPILWFQFEPVVHVSWFQTARCSKDLWWPSTIEEDASDCRWLKVLVHSNVAAPNWADETVETSKELNSAPSIEIKAFGDLM